MPQSIWQDKTEAHPPPQFVTPYTDTWAYIGAGIWVPPKQGNSWKKAPVNNRVDNDWVLLNDIYKPVDYVVQAEYNKVTIRVLPAKRTDITAYWFEMSPGSSMQTTPTYSAKSIYSNAAVHVFDSGVTANTVYTVNVRAEYLLGGEAPGEDPTPDWSDNSLQTFTTPNNPVPTPPLNLRSPNRGNTWIDLAWDASANGQAVKYEVWSQVGTTGGLTLRLTTPNAATRTAKITGLLEDTKYQWWVVALGPTGLKSQKSNVLKWATGHDEIYRTGSIDDEKLKPDEWGSWRKDIGWLDWHDYPRVKKLHHWVYQGYWPGPRNYGATTANTSQREQDGRYKGIITYDAAGFRHRLNDRFGYDVGGGFGRGEVTVNRVSIRHPYRQREPGNSESQYIRWWIAWATPFDGEPKLREDHRNATSNNKDDADHLDGQDRFKAGTSRDFLRLPRHWGRALVQGWIKDTGTKVNAVGMYRGDNDHNGYGTAGYARFSGHKQNDTYPGYKDNESDWTVLIDATWRIKTRSYLAPYAWS